MINLIRCPVCGANHDNPEYEAPSFKRTQSMKDFCPVCIRTVGNTWRGDSKKRIREYIDSLPQEFHYFLSTDNKHYIARRSIHGEQITRDEWEFLNIIAEIVCGEECDEEMDNYEEYGGFTEEFCNKSWCYNLDNQIFSSYIDPTIFFDLVEVKNIVDESPTNEHVNQFLINRVRQYAKANPVRKFRLSMTSKDTVIHRRIQDLGLKPNALITLKKNPTMQELLNACINVASENIQLREAIQNVAD